MTQDPNDLLMSGGARAFKFETKGATVKGVVARAPEIIPWNEFGTDEPKISEYTGQPLQQIRVILATDLDEDEDDDGERAIYIRGAMMKAVRDAIKKAGQKGLQVGGKLAVKYTGDAAPKTKGFKGAKQYQALYEAPDPMAQAAANEPEPEPEATPEPAAEDDADLKF